MSSLLERANRARTRKQRSHHGAQWDGTVVSVQRVIRAPAASIFAIVANAARHPEFDGSGQVVKAKPGAPERLSLGSTFGMSMKLGVPYTTANTVIEFEPDRRIAWQTRLSGPLGKLFGGRIWRYELEGTAEGTTVTESWDIREDKQGFLLKHGPVGATDGRQHDQDARAARGADRDSPSARVARVDRRADRAAIDAAWEERILPALSEYTRIPCLSPAFDPDWAERGAIAAAARLLLEWVRDQDPALQAEIVELEGRTPLLLIDNGGSGDPVVVYGHMDKQPPLGEWRSGLGPYEPVREGDVLYGRGHGRRRLRDVRRRDGSAGSGRRPGPRPHPHRGERGERQPRPPGPPRALRARIGRPRLVICLDSGGLSYDRLWLTTSLRGNLVVTVTAEVLTEGIHSGQGGGVVPSSFRILRRMLSGIEDEDNGRILLPELLRGGDTRGPPGQPRDARRGVPRQRGAGGRRAAPAGARPGRPAGRAHVGRRARGDRRRRPARAARCGQRAASVDDAEALAAAAARRRRRARLRRADLGPAHRRGGARHHRRRRAWPRAGSPRPSTPASTATLTRVSTERFGRAPGFVGEGGSIPFLADLQRGFPGTQFVATGVLGPHSNAHGPNEALHIPMAKAVTHAVAELLRSL